MYPAPVLPAFLLRLAGVEPTALANALACEIDFRRTLIPMHQGFTGLSSG
jgi:hypothetical protein